LQHAGNYQKINRKSKESDYTKSDYQVIHLPDGQVVYFERPENPKKSKYTNADKEYNPGIIFQIIVERVWFV